MSKLLKQVHRRDAGTLPPPRKALSPEARRALADAEARRAATTEKTVAKELHGRGGLDPVRYGDWEVNGLASDF